MHSSIQIVRHRRNSGALHELSATSWMLTFSDLLTLLLTFFVMRISVSSLDVERLVELLRFDETTPVEREAEKEVVPLSEQLAQALHTLPSKSIKTVDDGAVISLGGATFITGSDELSVEALVAVSQLAQPLVANKAAVRIAGHTDNVPISGGRFPSNWELSAARAISVARVLIASGVPPQRIAVVGYADTKPLASNETEFGRQENRRVEVFVRAP